VLPGATAQSQSSVKSSGSHLWPQQDALIYAITRTRKINHSYSLIVASRWYVRYLECKINDTWATLFQPVLVDINNTSVHPSDKDMGIVFEFLTAIVVLFRERKELALVDIVDKLYNAALLKDTDDDRSTATQLVFAIIGWISNCATPYLRSSLS
jgi:hypothetical protein